MKKKSIILLLISLLVLPTLSLQAQEDFKTLMSQGDSYADAFKYEDAAVAYMNALKLSPDNYEALYKAGDMYTELADHLSEKETYFNKAAELCEKAVEVNPDGWEGHFKLSVVYGRLGLFRGGKEKVKLAQKVRSEAERAIELNPNADLAIHVLARWHQEVASLSPILKFFAKTFFKEELKGSYDEAVKLFQRAIEINPTHIEHYLELAKTYKLMGKKELMREPLEKVLALPSVEDGDDGFKQEAKKMLEDL